MRIQLDLDGVCLDRLLRLKTDWTKTAGSWGRELSRLESMSAAARESGRVLSHEHYAELARVREEHTFAERQISRINERLSS